MRRPLLFYVKLRESGDCITVFTAIDRLGDALGVEHEQKQRFSAFYRAIFFKLWAKQTRAVSM